MEAKRRKYFQEGMLNRVKLVNSSNKIVGKSTGFGNIKVIDNPSKSSLGGVVGAEARRDCVQE